VPEVLVNLYTHCGNGYQMPSTGSLEATLQEILDGFNSVFIVLDALDECTEREKVLNWAMGLMLQKNKNLRLHLIITSRPEKEIDDKFKGYPCVDLVEESEGCDIVAYLNHQLDKDSDLQEWDLETQKEIKSTLMKQADGMYVFCYYLKDKIKGAKFSFRFRWVALQITELKQCASKNEVKKQLANLPEGLDETYDRILMGIRKKYKDHTKMFLCWLSFAARPITLEELAATATVDLTAEDGPQYEPDNQFQNIQRVLTMCSSLVVKSKGMVLSSTLLELY
jgi:hypothetical protein